MADPTIVAPQVSTDTGSELTMTAPDAANGNWVTNSGRMLLVFRTEADSAALVVTAVTPQTVRSLAVGDRVLPTMAASKTYICGPFPTATYNDANGYLKLTYTGTPGAAKFCAINY